MRPLRAPRRLNRSALALAAVGGVRGLHEFGADRQRALPVAFPPFEGNRDAFLTSQDGSIQHLRLTFAAPAPAARPAMRLTVTPRRVRRGQRVALRATVRSASTVCRGGVRLRVGRRSVRTDARGRATLPYRFGSTGLRTVVATKPGCAVARARVRVRR